jgi:arginine decarboxylase
MKVRYRDFVEQTYDFPTEVFKYEDDSLNFHGIDLKELVEHYGSPLKFTYLPKIGENIERARMWFNVAMARVNYSGKYNYCYCTKSSHFKHVIDEVLSSGVHLETSSEFDINIIQSSIDEGVLDKSKYIICNGFKKDGYLEKITELINDGCRNVIPVLDNMQELDQLKKLTDSPLNVGIRIASEEEPKFEFYTSRLGIGYKSIVPYYKEVIKRTKGVKLKMLHFFINTGIADNSYYWNELHKSLKVYCELKLVCPELTMLNIGGGFPIMNSMSFSYDYEYIASEIIAQIKTTCESYGVPEPDIFTEFGSFTVGESGGAIYQVLNQKQQNDRERWNLIDSSFMTTLPDSWAINRKFIMFPINEWDREYERVLLGGITCDSDDYYNSEQNINAIYLPRYQEESPMYIGFFHTGAYQESLGGFGGIQHCLTAAPKHVVINKNEDGTLSTRLFSKEQSYKSMLKILGY